MVVMTTTQHEPARDGNGRFAPQGNTSPEIDLAEAYLDDHSDGADFDLDDYYDVSSRDLVQPEADEDAFVSWLEEQRAAEGPQGIDEYFSQPEPELTESAERTGAWGSGTPF